MADEHSEKMIQLLEEIRDLTKLRIEKVEALAERTRQRADEAIKRHKEQQKEAKKRFYISLGAVFILGLLVFVLILVLG